MWSSDEIIDGFRARDVRAIDTAGAQALELTREAALTSGRLALRLGREHPVSLAYDRVVDELAALHSELGARLPVGWRRFFFPGRRSIVNDFAVIADRHEEAFVTARRDFIDAAREIVGVSLLEQAPALSSTLRLAGRGDG